MSRAARLSGRFVLTNKHLSAVRWPAIAVLLGTLTGCGTVAAVPRVSAGSAPTSAQVFTVQIDAPKSALPASIPAYFPASLRVHAGDSVVFNSNFRGSPHAVSFARSDDTTTTSCFRQLSEAGPCRRTDEPPTFDRSWVDYTSGLLPDSDSFAVRFSSRLPAGTYRYWCTFVPAMQGSVSVVPADVPVPTPAEVAAAGQQELDARVNVLQQQLAATPVAPSTVVGGISDGQGATATVFQPSKLTVNVGTTVTWQLTGSTVSFNSPEALWLSTWWRDPDGTVKTDPRPSEPAGAGPWDTVSYHSSGVLTGPFSLTFDRAGTYVYRCLIHPDMQGTVNVV